MNKENTKNVLKKKWNNIFGSSKKKDKDAIKFVPLQFEPFKASSENEQLISKTPLKYSSQLTKSQEISGTRTVLEMEDSLILLIFSYLDMYTMISVVPRVCQKFASLSKRNFIWKGFLDNFLRSGKNYSSSLKRTAIQCKKKKIKTVQFQQNDDSDWKLQLVFRNEEEMQAFGMTKVNHTIQTITSPFCKDPEQIAAKFLSDTLPTILSPENMIKKFAVRVSIPSTHCVLYGMASSEFEQQVWNFLMILHK